MKENAAESAANQIRGGQMRKQERPSQRRKRTKTKRRGRNETLGGRV